MDIIHSIACLFVLWLLKGPSTARSLRPTFSMDYE